MKKIMLLAIALCLAAGTASAQDPNRRDGNWWRNSQGLAKNTYITGFFDGLLLGCNFAYWAHVFDRAKAASVNDAMASCDFYRDRFLTNVTSGQLADGLNTFYADFRNRSIVIESAVWLVLNQIAGTRDVDQMIENFRRAPIPVR